MENNKIIIMLLVAIIVILGAGILALNPMKSNEPCQIEVVGDDSIYLGGNFTVKLTDSHGSPISGEGVNVTFTDDAGKEYHKNVTTGSSGSAVVKLGKLKAGEYAVSCSAGGDGRYLENSTSATVSITDEMLIDIPSYEQYYTKSFGDYTVKVYKWEVGTPNGVGGLEVHLMKNGKEIGRSGFSSRAYSNVNGGWKWSDWAHGESGYQGYHRYPVSSGVDITQVAVRVD